MTDTHETAEGPRCPVPRCGALGTADDETPMLCRGFGHWDERCMANWLSCDPEDIEPYADYLAEISQRKPTP